MEQRRLGRSGLKVSEVGIGCNNFGGRCDKAATQAVVDAAIDRGHHVVRHGRRLRQSAVGDVARAGARQPSQPGGDRHEVRDADGPDGARSRRFAALHHERGGGEPASARHRLHRPVSDARARSGYADRGNTRRARRRRSSGQGALHRLLELLRLADRRCGLDRAHSPRHSVRVGAEPLQPARTRYRSRSARQLRALRPRHVAVLPARRAACSPASTIATNRRRRARVSQPSDDWRSAR